MAWSWGGAAQGASRGARDFLSILDEGKQRERENEEQNYRRGREAEQDRGRRQELERSHTRQAFIDALELEKDGYQPRRTADAGTDMLPFPGIGGGVSVHGISKRPELGTFDPFAPGAMERVPGSSVAEQAEAKKAASIDDLAAMYQSAIGGDAKAQSGLLARGHPASEYTPQPKAPVRGTKEYNDALDVEEGIREKHRPKPAPPAPRQPVRGSKEDLDAEEARAAIRDRHRPKTGLDALMSPDAPVPSVPGAGGRGPAPSVPPGTAPPPKMDPADAARAKVDPAFAAWLKKMGITP